MNPVDPAILRSKRAAQPVADEQPRYARLVGLSWLHFLNDGSANYLPGILPAVLVALHQSLTLAGTVMSALLIGQAFQVISGLFADYVGGRLFIVAGVLGTSSAAAVIGMAQSIWTLIPALAAIGVSSSLFHPQALAGARRVSGARLGFGMSLFLVGGELGRGLWPLLASIVVTRWGMHYLWLLAAPAFLSVAALWRRLPQQTPRHPDARPISLRRHLRPLCALIGFSLLRALAMFGVVTYLPVLWHVRGYGLTEGAAAISVMLVVGIIGNIGGGHLADRIGRFPVLFGSSVLGSFLLGAFLLSSGPWQWILLGLLGIALFSTAPLSILIGQDLFPENRSLGSGIGFGLSNGLAVVALAALGLVPSARGPETVLWLLVGALLLACVASLFLPAAFHASR